MVCGMCVVCVCLCLWSVFCVRVMCVCVCVHVRAHYSNSMFPSPARTCNNTNYEIPICACTKQFYSTNHTRGAQGGRLYNLARKVKIVYDEGNWSGQQSSTTLVFFIFVAINLLALAHVYGQYYVTRVTYGQKPTRELTGRECWKQ